MSSGDSFFPRWLTHDSNSAQKAGAGHPDNAGPSNAEFPAESVPLRQLGSMTLAGLERILLKLSSRPHQCRRIGKMETLKMELTKHLLQSTAR